MSAKNKSGICCKKITSSIFYIMVGAVLCWIVLMISEWKPNEAIYQIIPVFSFDEINETNININVNTINISETGSKSSKSSCYVLYKTHKLTEYILKRIISAKHDVAPYECQFIVLYWISFGVTSLNNRTKQNLILFKEHNITYFLITDILIQTYLPNVYNDVIANVIPWLTKNFEWEMCDIPEVLWYRHNRDILNNNDNIWSIEWDVGWKGNLGDTLMKNFDLNDTLNNYGYLGFGLNETHQNWKRTIKKKPGDGWNHSHKYYGFNMSIIDHFSALLPAVLRLKPYLLEGMYTQLSNSLYLYCEMRPLSICNKDVYISKNMDGTYNYLDETCKFGNLYVLHREIFIRWGFFITRFNRKKWNDVLQNDRYPNNTLYHHLKF